MVDNVQANNWDIFDHMRLSHGNSCKLKLQFKVYIHGLKMCEYTPTIGCSVSMDFGHSE